MADRPRPDFDLTSARTFLVVVEAGGISAAARRLGLAKSVVSSRIGGLEQSTNATLFVRGPTLSPTDAGRRLYEGLRSALDDVDEVLRAISVEAHSLGGRIRVTVPSGLGAAGLGGLICRFLAEHSAIQAELHFSDAYVDLAAEGFDLALRIGQATDSDLVGRRICSIRRLVCASPGYLAAHGTPATVADLARHRAVGYALVQASGQWVFQRPGSTPEAAAPPRLAFLANSGEAMRDAARAGLGIALLPSFFLGDDLAAGRLVEVCLDARPLPLELWALHPRRRDRRRIVAALTGWLAERIGDPPYWEV